MKESILFITLTGNKDITTCTVGCSKEHPTRSYIRKNRAIALLRLLMQPLFAHLMSRLLIR